MKSINSMKINFIEKNFLRAVLMAFFGLIFLMSEMKCYATEVYFCDVENHWAKTEIYNMTKKNILSGYSDGEFKPENNVTMAEMIKMTVAAGGYTLVRSGDNVWPDYYIETGIKAGLVNREDVADYNRKITRYEIAEIVARFVDLNDTTAGACKLKDVDNAHKKAVSGLMKLGIVNGYEDKTFKGKKNVTRAEAVAMLSKAVDSRNELILKRKYDLKERIDLSNYFIKNDPNKSSIKTYYEVDGSKILVHDSGRYRNLDGYQIDNKIIDTKKVISVVKELLAEKRYVAVVYVPQNYGINQLRILFGNEEIDTLRNECYFGFTYYENSYYELARIANVDDFSENAYLKIELFNMQQSEKEEDELNKDRLKSALQKEFGSQGAKIFDYMMEKQEKFENNEELDIKHTEKKKFGNYYVNFYQKIDSYPQFYVEKIK